MGTTEPNELSFDDHVESLLAPAEAEAPNPEPGVEEPEAAPVEQTAGADDTPEIEDVADGDGEEITNEDEGQGVDDDLEQPAKFTVKVDGTDVEVTLNELQRSYSGQAHIQRGMNDAATHRKETEVERQAITQDRQRLAALIQNIEQTGMQVPVAPDLALMDKDPLAYMRADAQYKHDAGQYQAKQNAIRQQWQQHQHAETSRNAVFRQEQEQALFAAIPDLADPAKAEGRKRDIVQTGKDYGFSDDEMGAVTDARHIRVLDDARKWRRLQTSEAAAREKVKTARPVVKPGAKKIVSKATAEQDQLKRLRQSGSDDDALAMMFRA